MYKRGLTPRSGDENAVTRTITGPSPAVTGRIAIPLGPKLRHAWTFDERMQCQLMHYAVVKALDIMHRLGGKVGHRNLRAFSIETGTMTPAHKDDEPRMVRPGVRNIEVSLFEAVWETLTAMHGADAYATQLVVLIAAGVKWSRVVRTDLKGRGEKMLGYVRLNGLYRMWLSSHERLMPMLLQVEPRLTEVIEAELKKTARR